MHLGNVTPNWNRSRGLSTIFLPSKKIMFAYQIEEMCAKAFETSLVERIEPKAENSIISNISSFHSIRTLFAQSPKDDESRPDLKCIAKYQTTPSDLYPALIQIITPQACFPQ